MNPDHLEVSIDRQEITLFSGNEAVRRWPVSTAAKGVGFDPGSHRTPTGRFRVREMIGGGADPNTIFRGRQPYGIWDGLDDESDLILSRILRLEGLDPDNGNTFDRYIYIHGTNHESRLGQPCSHGCVRMSRADVIELFDRVENGIETFVRPPTERRGKLIFIDCDSTLSAIEGIDELARAAGPEAFHEIEALTTSAMNGQIPLDEVFPRRMKRISPGRDLCDRVAQQYLETMTPGSAEFVADLKASGWTPIILSGGFEPLIRPLADRLGIQHVEAVPLRHDRDGMYVDYGSGYPTTRNGGKPRIIREWREAMLPEKTVMVGDGISDLEARGECDLFIGYGGVVQRSKVKESSDLWVTDFGSITAARLDQLLDQAHSSQRVKKNNELHNSPAMGTSAFAMSSKTKKTAKTGAKKATKKASKGKRYTPAEKKEVIDFVNEVNASKGRGGQSAASKKFGISPLTISSWLKAGGAAPKKRGRKAAKARKPVATGGSLEKKLDQLKQLAQQIDATEKKLGSLKGSFESLKASL